MNGIGFSHELSQLLPQIKVEKRIFEAGRIDEHRRY